MPRRLHRSRRSSAKPNLLAKPGRRQAASPDIAATRARGGRTRIVERCGDPTCRHPGYPAIGPTPPPIHLASPAQRKRARRPCNDENRRRRSSSSRRGPPLRPRHRRHDVENGMNEKKKPTFAAARRKLFYRSPAPRKAKKYRNRFIRAAAPASGLHTNCCIFRRAPSRKGFGPAAAACRRGRAKLRAG
ncbi:hypothetical protein DM47_2794 [Burkholderia mallei]|nr:hypothetical protein DM47_2794 [Burkholderia mallei]